MTIQKNLASLFASCLLVSNLVAQPSSLLRIELNQKITAPDAQAGDGFGLSLDVDGNTMVVGSSRDSDFGPDSGSAYIFKRSSAGDWTFAQRLTASDARPGARFGFAVDIDDHTLVIGAVQDSGLATNAGAFYVFKYDSSSSSWVEVVKRTASDGAANDSFATGVAISGDVIIAGSRFDDDAGNGSGSAYVFQRDAGGLNNWGQVRKLTAADGDLGDQFGLEVAISGNTILVNSHLDDDACPADPNCNSGSVYTFERNLGGPDNWGQKQKLTASDAALGEEFGRHFAILGNQMVIGVDEDDAGPGKAYVFSRGSDGVWLESQRLFASDGQNGDDFAKTVSLDGENLILGSRLVDAQGENSGSAYFFSLAPDNSGIWRENTKLLPFDGMPGDMYGISVAVSGETIAIGSYLDDHSGSIDAGSVYVYNLAGSTLYAADDLDNRDTQIFSVELEAGSVALLGPVHQLADLETLAFDLETETLFGITAEDGQLWEIDRTTGALDSVCMIDSVPKFREISSSSFHPTTQDLWAYQYNRGLVILDLTDCSLTRTWNHPPAPDLRRKWDGIAWRPDGSVLYASQLTDLIAWDPQLETATVICSNLPKKTEGLEYAPDGRLLGSSDSKIFQIDPETCTVTEAYDLPEREDIESLTFTQPSGQRPFPSCTETSIEREAIEEAVIEAIDSVDDPWTDPDDFAGLMTTVEKALGCQLRSDTEAPALPQTQKSISSCARPGVNYCGPRTSEINPFLSGVVVPQCLNEICCRHDQCYGENCVASECFFTTQSDRCDGSFFAVCESACSLFDAATPSAIFVCTVARCLNGILPSPVCTQLRQARMLASPQCQQQLPVAQGVTQVNLQAGIVHNLVVFCSGGTTAQDGRFEAPTSDPRLVVLESVPDGSTWRWKVTGREGDGVTPMILSYSASCKASS